MTARLTLIPAYGRDYASKAAVIADWNAGKDFESVGYGSGGYVNLAQARELRIVEVNIRYKRLTQVCVVKIR